MEEKPSETGGVKCLKILASISGFVWKKNICFMDNLTVSDLRNQS